MLRAACEKLLDPPYVESASSAVSNGPRAASRRRRGTGPGDLHGFALTGHGSLRGNRSATSRCGDRFKRRKDRPGQVAPPQGRKGAAGEDRHGTSGLLAFAPPYGTAVTPRGVRSPGNGKPCALMYTSGRRARLPLAVCGGTASRARQNQPDRPWRRSPGADQRGYPGHPRVDPQGQKRARPRDHEPIKGRRKPSGG